MRVSSVVQFLLLVHQFLATTSLTTCPRQCICHEHSIACSCEAADKPELIISSLGSTYITSLVVHTCDKVTVLNGSFSGVVLVERLSFIAIGRLYFEPHAFKDILQSPRQLVIDECTIPSLAPVAFAGLSHIDHLWFRNSQIDVIAMEAFHYLTNIDYIYFHRTRIGRIERRAFSKMYQVDHLYFKESIDIEMIESEAFSESQIDEIIMDGVNIEKAQSTFLLNIDSESMLLRNCSIQLEPRNQESPLEIDGEQKMVEKCLIESSELNSLSPYELGCVVLDVTSSTIQRIGPVSRDIDTPVYVPEPSISSVLNTIAFSNCTIGSIDSFAFVNYSLSILSFQHSIIDFFKPKSIEKSRIERLEISDSAVKSVENQAIEKSKIRNFDMKFMEIHLIRSDFIDNSTIGKLRILSSKIEKIEKNMFKNSRFEKCEIDGNRVSAMDSAAFYGDNQVSSLSITANDLSTSVSSPSFLSAASALPTGFLLANNTIDCSISRCSVNSFLLNSPKHSPLLYQISSNRCRPPLPNNQSPCVEPRISTLEDHGITCRVSHLIADCVCVSSLSRLPLKIDANVSIVILGDCEHLEIDQPSAKFSQIYIFRTANLIVKALPSHLRVLKIFHSTVSLVRGETRAVSHDAQDWEISHSKIDKIGPRGLSDLRLVSLNLQHSRLSHISSKSTDNSSIDTLIIDNCRLETTEPLFAVSASLRMSHSLVFSSPRGLGAISSAQLQNNTLLECCRHPYLDYRNPMGLDTIDVDARCDQHFYGTRCAALEIGGDVATNHLPITSKTTHSNGMEVVFERGIEICFPDKSFRNEAFCILQENRTNPEPLPPLRVIVLKSIMADKMKKDPLSSALFSLIFQEPMNYKDFAHPDSLLPFRRRILPKIRRLLIGDPKWNAFRQLRTDPNVIYAFLEQNVQNLRSYLYIDFLLDRKCLKIRIGGLYIAEIAHRNGVDCDTHWAGPLVTMALRKRPDKIRIAVSGAQVDDFPHLLHFFDHLITTFNPTGRPEGWPERFRNGTGAAREIDNGIPANGESTDEHNPPAELVRGPDALSD